MSTPNYKMPDDTANKQTSENTKRKPNFKRPHNRVNKTLPPPRAKSTTETPLTNDPLWKDSFLIDGETGFVNELSSKEFNADAAGYVQLVESEYKAISDVDKYYAKAIPASAHAYYHQLLYWYKIALIAQKRGTASRDQDILVRFVSGYQSAMIAAGAGEYLEGLGDYQDNTGVKHLLKAHEPNGDGHFGRATAQTHGLYETLPAPAIFYQRVVEDLLSSQRGGRESDLWMLGDITPADRARQQPAAAPAPQAPGPARARAAVGRRERALARANDELDDDEDDEGGDDPLEEDEEDEAKRVAPNVNLLGWRKSRTLNQNQLSEMNEVLGPHPGEQLINQRYQINRELFELVEKRLRECKRYKMSHIPVTTSGSMVQQVTWKPLEYGASRFKQAIEYNGVAMTRTTLPLRAAIAAKVMCYRTLRREFEDDDDRAHNTWA